MLVSSAVGTKTVIHPLPKLSNFIYKTVEYLKISCQDNASKFKSKPLPNLNCLFLCLFHLVCLFVFREFIVFVGHLRWPFCFTQAIIQIVPPTHPPTSAFLYLFLYLKTLYSVVVYTFEHHCAKLSDNLPFHLTQWLFFNHLSYLWEEINLPILICSLVNPVKFSPCTYHYCILPCTTLQKHSCMCMYNLNMICTRICWLEWGQRFFSWKIILITLVSTLSWILALIACLSISLFQWNNIWGYGPQYFLLALCMLIATYQ